MLSTLPPWSTWILVFLVLSFLGFLASKIEDSSSSVLPAVSTAKK